jgi:hypothetical protein
MLEILEGLIKCFLKSCTMRYVSLLVMRIIRGVGGRELRNIFGQKWHSDCGCAEEKHILPLARQGGVGELSVHGAHCIRSLCEFYTPVFISTSIGSTQSYSHTNSCSSVTTTLQLLGDSLTPAFQ